MIRLIIFTLITFLTACGDYDKDQIPQVDLNKSEIDDLTMIIVANMFCSAMNRYSSDMNSPIEGESYDQNAEFTYLLIKKSIAAANNKSFSKHKSEIKYQDLKKQNFSVIADELNKNSTKNIYHSMFKEISSKSSIPLLSNCDDVTVVTRRYVDKYVSSR
ncbi:hypothetical protein [Vibrio tritonius]|uniref:hypothetical protein n=1 Tax=Vibrio tritonius TaxID=1435069 RepID=UPI00315CBB5B